MVGELMPKQNKEDQSQYFNCIKCGSCCNFFEMIINPQNLKLDNLSIREAFKKELGVEFEDILQCSIKVHATCIYLDKKTGLCKIHDNRPEICRNHFCQRYPKIEDEE